MTKKEGSNPDVTVEMEHTEVIEDTEMTREAGVTADSDPDVTETGTENSGESSAHEELTLMLEDARAKADEHWNQLLRANAELENTRKRARQDVENAHKFALEKFIQELLPVKDSLEMGLAAAGNGASEATDNNPDAAAQLVEGTELTLKMLATVLEKFGVAEIDPTGQPFNPETHQAMSMQESADHEPNTVMMVMQKGYQLNERLIRPAMVVVARAAAENAEGKK
ncbi:nucleotide exchange factor GrpE [Kaarinaea lacus]